MPTYQSKAELTEKLWELGETVPASWTRSQIHIRLEEIKAERQTPEDTKFLDLEKEFKAAQKNKSLLISLGQRLSVTLTGNETKIQLITKISEKVMSFKPSRGTDLMEFGQFSEMTYQGVMNNHADYAQWCMTMMKEGQTHWKLTRFATWAISQLETKNKGYQVTSAHPVPGHPSPAPSQPSNQSFSLVSETVHHETDQEELPEQDEKRIQELEAELQSLRRQTKVNSRAKVQP